MQNYMLSKDAFLSLRVESLGKNGSSPTGVWNRSYMPPRDIMEVSGAVGCLPLVDNFYNPSKLGHFADYGPAVASRQHKMTQ